MEAGCLALYLYIYICICIFCLIIVMMNKIIDPKVLVATSLCKH